MADRNSAEIFSEHFQFLANLLGKHGPELDTELLSQAKKAYKQTYNYDFSQYQMYCDDALRKLGIPVDGDEDE